MVTKVYYIKNSDKLDMALEKIASLIPCFIYREPIEMNYSQVEVQFRIEDVFTIERELAPCV